MVDMASIDNIPIRPLPALVGRSRRRRSRLASQELTRLWQLSFDLNARKLGQERPGSVSRRCGFAGSGVVVVAGHGEVHRENGWEAPGRSRAAPAAARTEGCNPMSDIGTGPDDLEGWRGGAEIRRRRATQLA
jgi:hypothetical protein